MLLTDLNDDVLALIFEKCSLDDALTLCYVCRRFQTVIECNTFIRKSLDLLLVGHRNRNAPVYQRY